jgi:hypothetical protein
MGILNDITGGYANTVKDAVEASALFTSAKKAETAATTTATAATGISTLGLKAFKIALASTGIGLAIVAIGVLVANWDRVTAALKGVLPSMDKVGQVMNKITEITVGVGTALVNYLLTPIRTFIKLIQGDFAGAVDEFKNGLNVIGNYAKGAAGERLAQQEIAQATELASLIKSNEKKIEVMKAGGKDTYALEVENSKNKQKLYKDDAEKLDEALQEEKVIRAGHQKEVNEANAKAAEDARRIREKAAADEAAALKAIKDKQLADDMKSAEDALAIANELKENNETPAQKEEREYLEKKAILEANNLSTEELTRQHLMTIADIFDEQDKEDVARRQKRVDDNNAAFAADAEAALANAEAAKEIERSKQEAFAQGADMLANTLNQASELLGKHTAAGKVAAIAATTIDTYRSATAAFAGMVEAFPGPWGIAAGVVAAGVAVAAGLANVKKIIAVKVPGKAEGSTPSAGGGSGAPISVPAVAPTFNVVGDSGQNTLAQAITGKSNEPVKAFVVSGDMTSAQQLDRNKITSSSIAGGTISN